MDRLCISPVSASITYSDVVSRWRHETQLLALSHISATYQVISRPDALIVKDVAAPASVDINPPDSKV